MNDQTFAGYRKKILAIIDIFYPQAVVYLFGSRARGNFREYSDIDIAIDAGDILSGIEHGQIERMIDLLNIPYKVDVVDFHSVPSALQEAIKREGILWKESKIN